MALCYSYKMKLKNVTKKVVFPILLILNHFNVGSGTVKHQIDPHSSTLLQSLRIVQVKIHGNIMSISIIPQPLLDSFIPKKNYSCILIRGYALLIPQKRCVFKLLYPLYDVLYQTFSSLISSQIQPPPPPPRPQYFAL